MGGVAKVELLVEYMPGLAAVLALVRPVEAVAPPSVLAGLQPSGGSGPAT